MRPRRRLPRVSEKVVQQNIVNLLTALGGQVYVLGTRRSRRDTDFGTHQTPGIPDLWCFLWAHPTFLTDRERVRGLWIECKAADGRASEPQKFFAARCAAARVNYVRGGVDEVIAWLIATGWVSPNQFAYYRVAGLEAGR